MFSMQNIYKLYSLYVYYKKKLLIFARALISIRNKICVGNSFMFITSDFVEVGVHIFINLFNKCIGFCIE